MRIAFPVEKNDGVDSIVFNHFGSANFFIIVNSDTDETEIVLNQDLGHEHGKCQPLKALGGKNVEAVVVGGIGGTAMTKLKKSGAKIFKAVDGTVRENLEKFKVGSLVEFLPFDVCGGHTGGCSH